MKLSITLLFIGIIGICKAQYHRTFFNMTNAGAIGVSAYQGLLAMDTYFNAQNTQFITNFFLDHSNGHSVIKLSTIKIGALGSVLEGTQIIYPTIFPSSGTLQFHAISNIVQMQNFRIYTLQVGKGDLMYQLWLKENLTTHQIVDSYLSPNIYCIGSFKSKKIGNKIVSYLIQKNMGLTRVAMDINSFTTPTKEIVDSSISCSNSNFKKNYGGVNCADLKIINGKEVLILSRGVANAVIYSRIANNNYTSKTTQVSTSRAVSAFMFNSNSLVITNGKTIELYTNGNLMTLNNFPANLIGKNNRIIYNNGYFHVFDNHQFISNLNAVYYKINSAMQIMDSTSGSAEIIDQIEKHNGFLYILGYGNRLNPNITTNGEQKSHLNIFSEKYSEIPKLTNNEYIFRFKPNHLQAKVGLGLNVFPAYPKAIGAVRYMGRTVGFSLKDVILGITQEGDTIYRNRWKMELSTLRPGPFTNPEDYDIVEEARYNHVFHVTNQMILNHIDSILYGSANYIPNKNILFWPGNGNTSKGQPAVIAPFYDRNQNSKYEPMMGDYPMIYGDNCLFNIVHYYNKKHPEKTLVYRSWLYAIDCPSSLASQSTIFRKIKITARNLTIDSLYFGVQFDGDVGYSSNDYHGTNVNLGLSYTYNATPYDFGQFNLLGFHDTLAATGILILKGFKQKSDGIDNPVGIQSDQFVNGFGYNDGIIDNEYKGLFSNIWETHNYFLIPEFEQQRNILKGLFPNGDSIYYGGSGIFNPNSSSNIPTRYIYPGATDSLHYGTNGIDPGFDWTEYFVSNDTTLSGNNANSPRDVAQLFSIGNSPIHNNSSITVDYAYITYRDSVKTDTIIQPILGLFNQAKKIRNAFTLNESSCGGNFNLTPPGLITSDFINHGQEIIVYPNPTHTTFQIKNISDGATITIYGTNGKLLRKIASYYADDIIDIGNLQGQLLIILIQEKSQVTTKKLVKF